MLFPVFLRNVFDLTLERPELQ